uniref:Uncharacterized protein n=1 Tax=Rhizophora mucronata TaxID=61149 RepID=A0A2P2N6Q5_RHIMU
MRFPLADFTKGFEAFLKIPIESVAPISFKANTSCPVGVSTHRDFALSER